MSQDWVAARQVFSTEAGPLESKTVHLIRHKDDAAGGHIVFMNDKVITLCGHLEPGADVQLALSAGQPLTEREEECKTCFPKARKQPDYVRWAKAGWSDLLGTPKSVRQPGKKRGPGKVKLGNRVAELEEQLAQSNEQRHEALMALTVMDERLDAWKAWADKVQAERPDRQVDQ